MSNFYCIWVRTGFEKQFIEKVQAVFDSFPEEENGKLHCVGKQIRLKSGKEYIDPLFPGYVFWETDNLSRAQSVRDEEGFIPLSLGRKSINPSSSFISWILEILSVSQKT